jgi:fructosamine-3-kinase
MLKFMNLHFKVGILQPTSIIELTQILIMWDQIAQQIAQTTGKPFHIENRRSVSGGCINQGYAISNNEQVYFVKVNHAHQIGMFEAEILGLQQMFNTHTIRVPQPICCGIADQNSYIVLEWLEFSSGGNSAWEEMGRNLAKMHQKPQGNQFGWQINNTIGSTPQINNLTSNWADFFAEYRIGYQLRLAKRKGGSFPQEDLVLEGVKNLLKNHHPQPSLVHGDLWSGNGAIMVSGEPVILDPATYYGDREVDLAMTELFGGFPAGFYRGYNEVWALDSGYQQRKNLYNLYHILNHFNLFGGGYGSQASRMIQQLF